MVHHLFARNVFQRGCEIIIYFREWLWKKKLKPLRKKCLNSQPRVEWSTCRVDELDKMMSREIKLIYVAFVYACVKTQNFAFCDKKGWKNVCLKRDENMHLTSLWGTDTYAMKRRSISTVYGRRQLRWGPSSLAIALTMCQLFLHHLQCKKSFQRVSFKRFFFSEDWRLSHGDF